MCMDPKYVRGTCLKYRKGDASWLVCTELRADDPEAIVARDEFKTLAWTTANASAGCGSRRVPRADTLM
jgi:hypothetical protein